MRSSLLACWSLPPSSYRHVAYRLNNSADSSALSLINPATYTVNSVSDARNIVASMSNRVFELEVWTGGDDELPPPRESGVGFLAKCALNGLYAGSLVVVPAPPPACRPLLDPWCASGTSRIRRRFPRLQYPRPCAEGKKPTPREESTTK